MVSVGILLMVLLSATARSQDPRHPEIKQLTHLGTYDTEYIWPIGDVSGDGVGDVMLWQQRDSTMPGKPPSGHLLVLRSRSDGQLPRIEDGEVIGCPEPFSDLLFLAAGDWDQDGWIDVCARVTVYGDTSSGNDRGLNLADVTVFWGSNQGYSLADTTRLENGAERWAGPYDGLSADLNGDIREDLFLQNTFGSGFSDGSVVPVPEIFIYGGLDSEQNREDFRQPTWTWWNDVPGAQRLRVADYDCDGAIDVAFLDNEKYVGVLYGRTGMYPDTTEVERIVADNVGGYLPYFWFADVTGDAVPELLSMSQYDHLVRIYIGLPGQRLKEQYGSGDDPAPLDSLRWWGRPWHVLKGPNHLSGAWFGFDPWVYDPGSADTAPPEEIWLSSSGYIVIYRGGAQLDDLIDAVIPRPGGYTRWIVNLGDITGDGNIEFAQRYQFQHRIYTQLDAIPETRPMTRLPEGTDRPKDSGVGSAPEQPAMPGSGLTLEVEPNPADDLLRISWSAASPAALIAVHDLGGRLVSRTIDHLHPPVEISTAEWPPGRYIITVYTQNGFAREKVVITR